MVQRTVRSRVSGFIVTVLLLCVSCLLGYDTITYSSPGGSFVVSQKAAAVSGRAFELTQSSASPRDAHHRLGLLGLSDVAQLPLMRMVSMEGNWGGNINAIKNLPDAYVQRLKDDHVNWLYISLPIFNTPIVDPRVRIIYRPPTDSNYANMYSFDDQDLANAVNKLRKNGINVFFSIMFMPAYADLSVGCNTAQYSVDSHLFGDPQPPSAKYGSAFGFECVDPELWWWNPSHPRHASNVATFWATYTDVAIKYARLAQQLGVGALALGEETDRLFRTRSSARFVNNFRDELARMVASVRAEYTGLVTYAQNGAVYTEHPEWWGYDTAAAAPLFKDLNLDVVGISAYYTLDTQAVSRVYSVPELEDRWRSVMDKYVVPVQTMNPGIPIVFTSVGTIDSVNTLLNPLSDSGAPYEFTDSNGDGVDDGMEQQRNYYQALVNVNKARNYPVRGLDFWGFSIDTDPSIAAYNDAHRTSELHGKPAEQVISATYAEWELIVPGQPSALSFSAGANTVALFWDSPHSGGHVTSYRVEIGSTPGASDIASVDTGNNDTTFLFRSVSSSSRFYIRVRAIGAGGPGQASNQIMVNLRASTSGSEAGP